MLKLENEMVNTIKLCGGEIENKREINVLVINKR